MADIATLLQAIGKAWPLLERYGIGAILGVAFLALYLAGNKKWMGDREKWAKERTQLVDKIQVLTKEQERLCQELEFSQKQALLEAKAQSQAARDHAALHESERNTLIKSIQTFTESLTAVRVLVEQLMPRRRR